MISIQLHAPGVFLEQIDFPENWNELHVQEVEAIAKAICSELKGELQVKSVILLEILKHRTQIKKIPVAVIQRLDPEALARDGIALVEFVYKEIGLSTQPYPTLKVGRNIYTGPLNDFENLTAGEFESCEVEYLKFKDDPDPIYLATIAAILYRRAHTPFMAYNAADDHYITYDFVPQVRHFADLPVYVLFAIFLWYSGCRALLPSYFPVMHEGGKTDEKDLLVFTKCIHAAAGPKNGSREQVRRTLLMALFFEMEQEAVKAKQLKELYERK